jgi:hypothetical protein
MDVGERARCATKRLPVAGPLRRLFYGHPRAITAVFIVVTAVAGAFLVHFGAVPPVLVQLIPMLLILPALVVTMTGFRLLETVRRARASFARGDIDEASQLLFEAVEEPIQLPSSRASIALGLAGVAVAGGQAERAVVLLRAIEQQAALPAVHHRALRHAQVMALVALGRSDDARAIAHAMRGTGRGTDDEAMLERGSAANAELLVEALFGSVDRAHRCAVEVEALPDVPDPIRDTDSLYEAGLQAFGWMLLAYAWDRVVRDRAEKGQPQPTDRRAAALLNARSVSRSYYGYLEPVAPEFVAFAERVTGAEG